MQNKNRIEMIVFDMDGTVVQYHNRFQSSWHALFDAYGIGKIVTKLEDENYLKKGKEKEWAKKEASILRGKEIGQAISFLHPIPYSKGIEKVLKSTKGKIKRGLLTTGIDVVAEEITKRFELEYSKYNILHRKDGKFTGKLTYIVPLWTKHYFLDEICKKFKINLENICYVGDNENDISCFTIVGLPIAFDPKTEETARAAKYIIKDFEELNKILK